jgi:hypothetical protein
VIAYLKMRDALTRAINVICEHEEKLERKLKDWIPKTGFFL